MKTFKTIIKALLSEGYVLSVKEYEDFGLLIDKSKNYQEIKEEIESVEGAYVIPWKIVKKDGKEFALQVDDWMLVFPHEDIEDDFEDISDYGCGGIIHELTDKLSSHYLREGV
tara:strand:+ start:834 stop:1172 length:339 start_codon:yes stop_codon:yes gene_type:complete